MGMKKKEDQQLKFIDFAYLEAPTLCPVSVETVKIWVLREKKKFILIDAYIRTHIQLYTIIFPTFTAYQLYDAHADP